jgi:hypothetical protein
MPKHYRLEMSDAETEFAHLIVSQSLDVILEQKYLYQIRYTHSSSRGAPSFMRAGILLDPKLPGVFQNATLADLRGSPSFSGAISRFNAWKLMLQSIHCRRGSNSGSGLP